MDDLKKKINFLLKQEKKEKEQDDRRHQDDVQKLTDVQVQYQNQLKQVLTNVNQ